MAPPLKKAKVEKTVPKPTKTEVDRQCSICMERMHYGEKPYGTCRMCLSCGQKFHRVCIETWFRERWERSQKLTCPMCRYEWFPWLHHDYQQQQGDDDDNDGIVILDDHSSI